VQTDLNHALDNVYLVVSATMVSFVWIINRIVRVFLNQNVTILYVMIQMQNIQNVDRHVHAHVMTNVTQFENLEYVQQCVNVVAFVKKVLFLKTMENALNMKPVVR
jgi:hypothetical protein